jgi:pimeloyl-ACP methyl ester carboxylesterase
MGRSPQPSASDLPDRRGLSPLIIPFDFGHAPQPGTVAVFVHGLFSRASTWTPLIRVLRNTPELRSLVGFRAFEYYSPKFKLDPRRRIPDLHDVADQLMTYISTDHLVASAKRLILIGHSHGGLVVQTLLARAVSSGRGRELARIRRVVLIATPNTGSELLLSVRRWFDFIHVWTHPHERVTRPLDEQVASVRRVVLERVFYATSVGDNSCPIPFDVLAGTSDGVVPTTSARGAFPNAELIEGDHNSVLDPRLRGSQTAAQLARSILRGHQAIPVHGSIVRTETLGLTQDRDLAEAVALQHDRFAADAHMRLDDLRACLANYERRWGLRPQLLVTRVDSKIEGMMLFSETAAALVVGLLAVRPSAWSSIVTHQLVTRLGERSRELGDRPILFEVQVPQGDDDRRAWARVRLFQRYGARVMEGVRFLSPDMSSFPERDTEREYLVMYGRPGHPQRELRRQDVATFIASMYEAFYFCWFETRCDAVVLRDYLNALIQRVVGPLPERITLTTIQR